MYFAGKTAELFHRAYAVLDGFEDASRILTDMLNVLERPPLFLVEPLQKKFNVFISTLPVEERLNENESWNL